MLIQISTDTFGAQFSHDETYSLHSLTSAYMRYRELRTEAKLCNTLGRKNALAKFTRLRSIDIVDDQPNKNPRHLLIDLGPSLQKLRMTIALDRFSEFVSPDVLCCVPTKLRNLREVHFIVNYKDYVTLPIGKHLSLDEMVVRVTL